IRRRREAATGGDHDGNVGAPFGEMTGEIDSVAFSRHLDVGEDGADVASPVEDLQRLADRTGAESLEALLLQDVDRVFADQDLVRDHEDGGDIRMAGGAHGCGTKELSGEFPPAMRVTET